MLLFFCESGREVHDGEIDVCIDEGGAGCFIERSELFDRC